MNTPDLNKLFEQARKHEPIVNINEVHSMIQEVGSANPSSKPPISNLVKTIIMSSTLGLMSLVAFMLWNVTTVSEPPIPIAPQSTEVQQEHSLTSSQNEANDTKPSKRSIDDAEAQLDLNNAAGNEQSTESVNVSLDPGSIVQEPLTTNPLPVPPPPAQSLSSGLEGSCQPEFETIDLETQKSLGIRFKKGVMRYAVKSKVVTMKITVSENLHESTVSGDEKAIASAWKQAPQAMSKLNGSDFVGLGAKRWPVLQEEKNAGNLFAIAIGDEEGDMEEKRLLWFLKGQECPGALCNLEARSSRTDCFPITFRSATPKSNSTDGLGYPEEFVIDLDAKKMTLLGFETNEKGILFHGQYQQKTLFLNYGAGRKTIFNALNQDDGLNEVEFVPIYASEDLAYGFSAAFSWDGSKKDKLTWLRERCGLIPLKYEHSSSINHYFWYEPSIALLEVLGMSHYQIQDLKRALAANCPNGAVFNASGDQEYSFDELFENPSYVEGIRMLTLSDEVLSRLGIYVENKEIIHISGISSNHYSKKGSLHHFNIKLPAGFTKGAGRAPEAKDNTMFAPDLGGERLLKEVKVFLGPEAKELTVYSVEIVAPQFITDDHAQVWRSITYPDEIKDGKEEASQEDMDRWMRETINSSLLLPVLVRSGEDYTPEDKIQGNMRPDCIFWYEPTDEFLALLPEDLAKEIKAEMQKINSPSASLLGEEAPSCTYFEACSNKKGSIAASEAYPSPARTQVNITLNSIQDAKGRIILSDAKGNALDIKEVNLVKDIEHRTVLDVSGLSEGIYLVTIQSNKGDYITKRIIKVGQ